MDAVFNQKKVNHIFHYTTTFERLVGILLKGFAPSYCQENITDLTYLIPMVSFCNISIRDVDLYMRYGSYGVGMTVEWAIQNRISPVIYIHESSPFNDLHSQVNKVLLWDLVNRQLADAQQQFEEAMKKGETYNYSPPNDPRFNQLLATINELTVPTLQFFKNWKTIYEGNEIVTYQEREWRYVPTLDPGERIIPSTDAKFEEFADKNAKPKPHLPDKVLNFDISDIRYVIIKREDERDAIVRCLAGLYKPEVVTEAIVSGKLLILTDRQVRDDF